MPDGTGRRVTISLLDNGKELIEVLPPQTAKEESKPGRVAIASDHAEHRRLQADTWL
jgi:hypothetical protein